MRIKNLFKPKFSPFFVILAITALIVIELITLKYFMSHLKAATFQSPLPGVTIAKASNEILKTKDIYSKQYDFGSDMFTARIPVWKKALAPFKGKPNINYLEVGAYEGRSVIWILENILTDPSAKTTVIDIFLGPYKDKYFANIELTGVSEKVTTITGQSQLALRELPFESFDIVYIDGSHLKNDVLEDAVLSWRLVKKGGILIFDDYRYTRQIENGNIERYEYPKIAIDGFAQCFDQQFDVIHNAYQLILKRKVN